MNSYFVPAYTKKLCDGEYSDHNCHVLLQMYISGKGFPNQCVILWICVCFCRVLRCATCMASKIEKQNTNYENIWKCCNLRWKTFYKNWKRQLSEWVWTLNTVAIWVSTNFYLFEIELVTIACFGICLTLSVELLVFGVWFGTFYQT